MNFLDATFLRLADPASRTGVFDDVALEQFVQAAFEAELLGVEGPFQPVFDEFRLGPPTSPPAVLEGMWNPVGGVDRTEVHLRVLGLPMDGTARVDALWRGAIVAQVVTDMATIAGVEVTWPDPSGIDDEIVSDLGSLPADPAVLERERRARLLTRIRAAVSQSGTITDASLDAWLARLGVATVGELLTTGGARVAAAARVTFSPGGQAQAVPRPLPLAALLLVRDVGFPVAELVAQSNALRERAATMGLERPADPALPRRAPVLIVWVIPPETFDDPGWPGGFTGTPAQQRAARRAAAGAWLAREGIGLATPPP